MTDLGIHPDSRARGESRMGCRRKWLDARRTAFLLLIVGVLASLLYLFIPSNGSLRVFNPETMAALETRMWRHYYEGRYGALGLDLYLVTRGQYHLSPWAAAWMAYNSTVAARVFQESHNRLQAEAAVPYLERSYRCLAENTGEPFDYKKAAALELGWWQQRREDIPPTQYAETIAELMRQVYRSHDPRLKQASLIRAQMMAYRDARRNGRMKPSDWRWIEENLRTSYQIYSDAVQQP